MNINNHSPENPFVPQISIFLQPGAIFELRIHLCGFASDVGVVPYNDKLFISGNAQPQIQPHQMDHHTASTESGCNLVWSDQPYGRFGRDVPAQLKPGTECVIMSRGQDGGDYVIRYTIQNIRHDPFQQANHHYMNATNSVYSPYSNGVNTCHDSGIHMASPRQHVFSNQESVFAPNFTNANVSGGLSREQRAFSNQGSVFASNFTNANVFGGVDICPDPGIYMGSPCQIYREQHVVSNQESVFASNFTNANMFSTDSTSVFVEGISHSADAVRFSRISSVRYTNTLRVCQMPMQDMVSSGVFDHETYVSGATTMPPVFPDSSFYMGSSTNYPHAIPNTSTEQSCAFPPPHCHPRNEHPSDVFLSGREYAPVTLDAGTSYSAMNNLPFTPGETMPIPVMQNNIPMNPHAVLDNSRSDIPSYPVQNFHSGPSDNLAPGTIPTTVPPCIHRTAVVNAIPSVELPPLQSTVSQPGVCERVLPAGQSAVYSVPSNSQIHTSRSVHSESDPPPLLMTQEIVQPSQSLNQFEQSRDANASGGVRQDVFPIPTAEVPAPPIIYRSESEDIAPSHGDRTFSQEPTAAKRVSWADLPSTSRISPSAPPSIPTDVPHYERFPVPTGASSSISVANHANETSRSLSFEGTSGAHDNRYIREERNDASGVTREVIQSTGLGDVSIPIPEVSRFPPTSSPREIVPPIFPSGNPLPVPSSSGEIPAMPPSISRDMPQPTFGSGSAVPVLDAPRSNPPSAIPGAVIPPELSRGDDRDSFSSSTTSSASSKVSLEHEENVESGMSSSSWRGTGYGDVRSVTAPREIASGSQAEEVIEIDVNRHMASKRDTAEVENVAGLENTVPSVGDVVNVEHRSTSVVSGIRGDSVISDTISHTESVERSVDRERIDVNSRTEDVVDISSSSQSDTIIATSSESTASSGQTATLTTQISNSGGVTESEETSETTVVERTSAGQESLSEATGSTVNPFADTQAVVPNITGSVGIENTVAADVSTSTVRDETVINTDTRSAHEESRSETSIVGGDVAIQRSSVPADAAPTVVQVLTEAAVGVVEKVVQGETFTEALIHTVDGLQQSFETRESESDALNVSTLNDRGISESSSSQLTSTSGQVTVSESSLAQHEDLTIAQAGATGGVVQRDITILDSSTRNSDPVVAEDTGVVYVSESDTQVNVVVDQTISAASVVEEGSTSHTSSFQGTGSTSTSTITGQVTVSESSLAQHEDSTTAQVIGTTGGIIERDIAVDSIVDVSTRNTDRVVERDTEVVLASESSTQIDTVVDQTIDTASVVEEGSTSHTTSFQGTGSTSTTTGQVTVSESSLTQREDSTTAQVIGTTGGIIERDVAVDSIVDVSTRSTDRVVARDTEVVLASESNTQIDTVVDQTINTASVVEEGSTSHTTSFQGTGSTSTITGQVIVSESTLAQHEDSTTAQVIGTTGGIIETDIAVDSSVDVSTRSTDRVVAGDTEVVLASESCTLNTVVDQTISAASVVEDGSTSYTTSFQGAGSASTITGQVIVSESSLAQYEDSTAAQVIGTTGGSIETDIAVDSIVDVSTRSTDRVVGRDTEVALASESSTQISTVVDQTINTTSVVEEGSTSHTTSFQGTGSTTTTTEVGVAFDVPAHETQAQAIIESSTESQTVIEQTTDITTATIVGSPHRESIELASETTVGVEQVINDSSATLSLTEGGSTSQSIEANFTTLEGAAEVNIGRSTENIGINSTTQASSNETAQLIETNVLESSSRGVDSEVTSDQAAVEGYTVDTVVTTTATTMSSTERDASMNDASQSILVHDALVTEDQVEEDKASGENSTPMDSNIVPVPNPPSTVALRTSTRQDVVFENQSNASNLSSTQSVIGQVQIQEASQQNSNSYEQAEQVIGSSMHEFIQTGSLNVENSARTRTSTVQTAFEMVEVPGETGVHQQMESHVPSVVIIGPESPVDVIVSVPSSRGSSSRSLTTAQDTLQRSTTTNEEEAISKKSALSNSDVKEVEAQASLTVMSALTSSAASKDTLYTPASTSSPLQYDPPPAYSPARTNTIVNQSHISNVIINNSVFVNTTDTRMQVSSQSRSEMTTTRSAAQGEASHVSSSEVIGKAGKYVTSSIADLSQQRATLVRQSSTFSDYVEVNHEESEREVTSMSDSSDASLVRTKSAKKSITDAHQDVGAAAVTEERTYSDDVLSEKSTDVFVGITKQTNTSAITNNLEQSSLHVASGSLSEDNSRLTNIDSLEDTRVTVFSADRDRPSQEVSESGESSHGSLEPGFLQGLHQDTSYIASTSGFQSTLSGGNKYGESRDNSSHSKQDLEESEYVNVYIDQSSESISKDLVQTHAQVATTDSKLASTTEVIETVIAGSEVDRNTSNSSQDSSANIGGNIYEIDERHDIQSNSLVSEQDTTMAVSQELNYGADSSTHTIATPSHSEIVAETLEGITSEDTSIRVESTFVAATSTNVVESVENVSEEAVAEFSGTATSSGTETLGVLQETSAVTTFTEPEITSKSIAQSEESEEQVNDTSVALSLTSQTNTELEVPSLTLTEKVTDTSSYVEHQENIADSRLNSSTEADGSLDVSKETYAITTFTEPGIVTRSELSEVQVNDSSVALSLNSQTNVELEVSGLASTEEVAATPTYVEHQENIADMNLSRLNSSGLEESISSSFATHQQEEQLMSAAETHNNVSFTQESISTSITVGTSSTSEQLSNQYDELYIEPVTTIVMPEVAESNREETEILEEESNSDYNKIVPADQNVMEDVQHHDSEELAQQVQIMSQDLDSRLEATGVGMSVSLENQQTMEGMISTQSHFDIASGAESRADEVVEVGGATDHFADGIVTVSVEDDVSRTSETAIREEAMTTMESSTIQSPVDRTDISHITESTGTVGNSDTVTEYSAVQAQTEETLQVVTTSESTGVDSTVEVSSEAIENPAVLITGSGTHQYSESDIADSGERTVEGSETQIATVTITTLTSNLDVEKLETATAEQSPDIQSTDQSEETQQAALTSEDVNEVLIFPAPEAPGLLSEAATTIRPVTGVAEIPDIAIEDSTVHTQAEETLSIATSELTVVNGTEEVSSVAIEHPAILLTESKLHQSSEFNNSVGAIYEDSETEIVTTFTSNLDVESSEHGTIEQNSDSQFVEQLGEISQTVVTSEYEAPAPEVSVETDATAAETSQFTSDIDASVSGSSITQTAIMSEDIIVSEQTSSAIETTTSVVENSSMSSNTHIANDTENSVIQTIPAYEEATGIHSSVVDVDVSLQHIVSSSEMAENEIIQESQHVEEGHNLVIEDTFVGSEKVDRFSHEDDNTVSLESNLELTTHREEEEKAIAPSRRDSMATTSEGSVDTSTATIRQLGRDRSLLSTPYHQFLTMASPSKATLATLNVTALGSFEAGLPESAGSPQNQSTILESTEETEQHIDSEMSMVSSPPKSPEEEVHGEVVQGFAEYSEIRRNTTPTMDEVPNIDIEPDDSVSMVDYREDDALTIDIQTAAASSESASRPVSFYSADDRTVDLYTPTDDDGDYPSTVFHSGSAGTSRALTSTAEDFYSTGDVTAPATYIHSPSAESIADQQQLVTSPETIPPTPSTLAAYIQPYSDQRNNEIQKTTESYSSSSSTVVGKQEVQTTVNQSTTTNERQTSRWTQFDLMGAYRSTTTNNRTTLQGKRRSASTDYVQMKKF